MNTFHFNHKSIGIFLTAYYPNRKDFIHHFMNLQNQDIDFIEIGIPYSDPVADGNVIQHASEVALNAGFILNDLFDLLNTLQTEIKKPLVLMGYGNQVIQYGIDRFLSQCKKIGIKALIFPDLPIEMWENHPELKDDSTIPFVHLVTPGTSNERIAFLAERCKKSFIYLVGSSQTTGGTYDLSHHLDRYKEIKKLCKGTPVFLGFGIDSAAKKNTAFQAVDGIIVGSAYLKALSSNQEQEFLHELISC